jgi:hypothetical protein
VRPLQRAASGTTLGQPGAVPIGCMGSGPTGAMLAEEGAGAPTYTAGFDGVLTSYTYVANGVAGQVRAVVFADTATTTTKAVIGKSAKQTITVSTTNTFPIRVPIKTGQHLGLALTENLMACATAGVTGDLLGAHAPFDPDVDTTLSYEAGFNHGLRPNIAAVLEPDVDGDGFGDVSQDLCPQSKLLQTACSPDTTVTKAPKKSSTKRKAKITFSSTVAGSTFTCAVDKKPAAPCTSPFKKKFKYGKHTVLITAISPLGVADLTPATVKFKIKRPKR